MPNASTISWKSPTFLEIPNFLHWQIGEIPNFLGSPQLSGEHQHNSLQIPNFSLTISNEKKETT